MRNSGKIPEFLHLGTTPSVKTRFGKMLFWCVWMTSVERLDNDVDALFDNEIITLRNVRIEF